MFEKIGRKLVRGAKAEMMETPDKLTDILDGALKIGLFMLVLLVDGTRKKAPSSSTVIVNNYIYKEEKNGLL